MKLYLTKEEHKTLEKIIEHQQSESQPPVMINIFGGPYMISAPAIINQVTAHYSSHMGNSIELDIQPFKQIATEVYIDKKSNEL